MQPELASEKSLSPDQVLDIDDTGDDVLRRFRYQLSYAAILSILMLETENDVIEVFCELHEDVLLKHSDNTFTGCQVKTKDINLNPFTIDDDAIKKSCRRFTTLNNKFPEQFRQFEIISNAGFATSKPAVCLQTLLEVIKSDKAGEFLKKKTKATAFIKALTKQCGCSHQQVIEALSKVRIKTYSALSDIHIKLNNQLKVCTILKGTTESKLEEIADLILAKHLKASSLHFDDSICFAYIQGGTPINDDALSIIHGKRFTKGEIEQWLTIQKELPVSILLKDRVALSGIPKGHRILEIKMDAGRIDAENIGLMKNFKFSFENHAISWLYKNGPTAADDKYSQITYITQNICKEIYDEQTLGEKHYGLPMLVEARKRIKQRYQHDASVFFDCAYEHVLGVVAVLTESCKIWWSEKFDLPND